MTKVENSVEFAIGQVRTVVKGETAKAKEEISAIMDRRIRIICREEIQSLRKFRVHASPQIFLNPTLAARIYNHNSRIL